MLQYLLQCLIWETVNVYHFGGETGWVVLIKYLVSESSNIGLVVFEVYLQSAMTEEIIMKLHKHTHRQKHLEHDDEI